jgi:hypothetical protein
MPNASEIRKFARSLKSGMTDITNALDKLFGEGNPSDLLTSPDEDVRKAATQIRDEVGSLATLSPEMRRVLEGKVPGGKVVGTKDLDHIDAWDENQKEDVRLRLRDSLMTDHLYHFFWELHRGTEELTEVPPLPLPGTEGEIHFRSPRGNVQEPTPFFTLGDVKVTVGEENS